MRYGAGTAASKGGKVEAPSEVPAADQGLVSWTPKREGQGSWDKNKAAAASLEAPVWQADLVRGVHTGVIKIKQVCSFALAVFLKQW